MKTVSLIFSATMLLLSPQMASAQQDCPPSTTPGIHVVQKGENLYRIAKAYEVTMEQLGVWNNIDPKGNLSVCKALYVQAPDVVEAAAAARASSIPVAQAPAATAPQQYGYSTQAQPAPAAAAKSGTTSASVAAIQGRTDGVHILSTGQTVADIAEFYGYTEARFRAMNNLDSGVEPVAGSALRTTDCDCNMRVWMVNTANAYTPQQYTTPNAGNSGYSGAASNTYPPATVSNQGYNQPNNSNPAGTTTYTRPEDQLANRTNSNPTGTTRPQQYSKSNPPPSTASNASYMSAEERQMLDEINLMRANPTGYIKYIQEYIDYLNKNGNMGNSISTSYELIEELKRTPKLSVLQPSQCIYQAAKKHGIDQKPLGDVNHNGTDGSWPWDRVTRECPSLQDGNENIVGGPSDIRRAVILLLVDDGIDSRGHRKTLLDSRWTQAACYKVGQVGSMPNVWIQNFGF